MDGTDRGIMDISPLDRTGEKTCLLFYCDVRQQENIHYVEKLHLVVLACSTYTFVNYLWDRTQSRGESSTRLPTLVLPLVQNRLRLVAGGNIGLGHDLVGGLRHELDRLVPRVHQFDLSFDAFYYVVFSKSISEPVAY